MTPDCRRAHPNERRTRENEYCLNSKGALGSAVRDRIAIVRLTCDPRTQAYAERRRAEGKTSREIIRCLKHDAELAARSQGWLTLHAA